MSETVFVPSSPSLHALISDIQEGSLSLPELQRPFVWKRTKVRDLLDSMYRGYPVGYLLFWKSPEGARVKEIAGIRSKTPSRVIVDGQQRLTSLYAVLRGEPLLDENFVSARIRIAFRPEDGHFEVANSATDRDPEYLPDISVLWSPEHGPNKTRKAFVERIQHSRPSIDGAAIEHLEDSLDRLFNLQHYPFSALELRSNLDEEVVAEIFVRINSEGVSLNQADFILTLMSVFWDEGRRELEAFSRSSRHPSHGQSPYNVIITPGPDQLLRVAVGLAFERAVLSAVYALLRGRDLQTKQMSDEIRDRQFAVLKEAQAFALDLTNWHEFLKVLRHAGYRSGKTIASQTSVIYAYTLYLIGLRRHSMDRKRLRGLISRWFFMCAVTGRYTGSSESAFEKDLARLRSAKNSDEFEAVLDHLIDLTLTSDFWTLTLPNLLATSSSRSPYLLAYDAALCILDARALFSSMRVGELQELVAHGKRAPAERHHLFPTDFLESKGMKGVGDRNQIANLALVEWTDNAVISNSDPAVYWLDMTSSMSSTDLQMTKTHHALPDGWQSMPYQAFLEERRRLMARTIRGAFELLRTGAHAAAPEERPTLEELVGLGESSTLEFKSSARWNLHSGGRDDRMEHKILIALAGFMNADGGTLLVGVDDKGSPLGLDNDYSLLKRKDQDGWRSWLSDHVVQGVGKAYLANMAVTFEPLNGIDIGRIVARPSTRPVWVKGPSGPEFYARFDNSTRQMQGNEILEYVADRWGEGASHSPV